MKILAWVPEDKSAFGMYWVIRVGITMILFSERYRKSYPSASSSFASSSYREDSTDTDSSLRSPNLSQYDRAEAGEPHYQFRKSNSMKLALKEGMIEGD